MAFTAKEQMMAHLKAIPWMDALMHAVDTPYAHGSRDTRGVTPAVTGVTVEPIRPAQPPKGYPLFMLYSPKGDG